MGSSDQDQPGAVSRPEDTRGDGPVTLGDRTEPGGQGSPGANQAGTEPAPAPALGAPDLDSMNVGGADPQAPRHPAALRSDTSGTGSYASGLAPAGPSGPRTTTGPAGGTAHRAPGMDGTVPDGESVTTDTAAGAARMGPQAQDSAPGSAPGQGDDASGTSQEHRVVTGIKPPAQSTD